MYHLDTKKRGDFSSADGEVVVSEDPPPVFKTAEGQRVVWQPIYDDEKKYSKWFTDILNAGIPAVVDIDETKNVTFGKRIPRGLSLLLAQGRSSGIWVIGGTQHVFESPRELLSQATWIISFLLTYEYDVNTMLRYLNKRGERRLNLKKYQLFAIRPDDGEIATLYNNFEEFLKNIT